MKWIFLAGLLVLTPLMTAYLSQNRRYLPHFAFVLGLLPFIEQQFNVSATPIGLPAWPGIVKGVDLSLTDALAVALLLAGSRVRTPLAIKLSFALFLCAYLISLALAETKMPTFFYGWQLIRTVLVFLAVARASIADSRVPMYLLTGLMTGLCVQAVVVAVQYAGGARQAGGWFHQNSLGMLSHFIVYPAFAALLGGYCRKRALLTLVAAFVIAYGGGSRATIGLLVAGLFMTALFSSWYRTSGRKSGFIVAGLLAIIAISPLLYSAIDRRSPDQIASSNSQRVAMEAAARMIMTDHPLGVGANRYVIVTNVGGYSARAGVAWNEQNRAAPVHNSYYLVTAEMGFLGLIGFVAILGTSLGLAVQTFRKSPPRFEGEYAAGLSATFIVVAAHSWFEWITMLYGIHILFAMSLGILVAARARLSRSAAKAALAGSGLQSVRRTAVSRA